MTAHRPPDRCHGPLVDCIASTALMGGQARHRRPVPCVGCGAAFTIARYVVDAGPVLPDGRPAGGHLCLRCDPLRPTAHPAARKAATS